MSATVTKLFRAACKCEWSGPITDDKRLAEAHADQHHCGAGVQPLLDDDEPYRPDEDEAFDGDGD